MSASALALADVNGRRFGRLVAVGYIDSRQKYLGPRIPRWEFICDCGNTYAAPLFKVRRGGVRSCGCAEREEEKRLLVSDQVSPFISQHGRYETFAVGSAIGLVETSFSRATVNRTHSVIDGWIDEEIFERRHVRVIEYARDLWRDMKRPTHDFFDSFDPEDERDGFDSERAKCLLKRCRNLVGCPRWRIFENVARWNEPGGISGSRLLENPQSAEAKAKASVLETVEMISRSLIL